jgi:hypothetical protein
MLADAAAILRYIYAQVQAQIRRLTLLIGATCFQKAGAS